MKTIANIFLKGVLFTLPIIVTFGLLYWLFATAESVFRVPLQWLLPEGWYVTGLGLACGVALIFCVGLLVRAYFVEYLFRWIDNTLEHIPLVKTLYISSKDLMAFFAGGQEKQMDRVVRVKLTDDVSLVGFVTNDAVKLGDDTELMAVYFPMSYQVGGYTAYMPKSRCELLDIPVQKAMQQVLTAHIKR